MSLPVPVLDDRTYQQLVAELTGRIAAYTPEWTDQGASDPGVTLLELFAFLGENLLYRFNQIPDATKLWLLRLLQVPPRPGRAAGGLVTLDPKAPSLGPPVVVDAGTLLRAGSMPFETGQDLVSLPVVTRALVKLAAPAPTDPELVAGVERAIDARGGLAPGEAAQYYNPSTLQAAPGAPGVSPLDVPDAVDGVLWVPVIAAGSLSAAQLLVPGGPLDGQTLNLGVALDDQFPTIDGVDPCRGLDPSPPPGSAAPPPQLAWQVSTSDTTTDSAGVEQPVYVPLEVVADSTASLTTSGVVRLALPAGLVVGSSPIGVFPDPDPDLAGTGNLPPVLDDAPPVVCWLRAYPPVGAPAIAALSWVGANAVTVDQMQTVGPEFVGTGTGQPSQTCALVHPSVDPPSLDLQVEESGGWVSWQQVETFAAAGPADRVYVLDAASGTVTCGDTVRGHAFAYGQRIRARTYRCGGGAAGNVAPKAVSTIDSGAPVAVANPLALAGGAEPETIAEALTRIPGEFARHERAVTASDFAQLAAIVGVGRAECLAHFYPPTRDPQAAGVVSVVVWPDADPLHPDAPVPDQALLGAVCAELDGRRLVTTELYVIPPTYHPVAISVGVAVKPGFSGTAVCRWVDKVVRQYLAPLPPYGPDGRGWPLGQRVFGPELLAVALQVDGIDYLEDLRVSGPDATGTWVEGTVALESWEVVQVTELTVVVGPALDPGQPVPAPATPHLVPIPVPPDEC
jgi:hypothetical protein